MIMNLHHVELFYYVAKHGGISRAVRKMPYGIQQPAISSQIIQLEEFLGAPLFQRRPFELTAAGRELFDFIEPFFSNLEAVGDKLRGGVSQHVRIGASSVVLRDHLPWVIGEVRKRYPELKLTLRSGHQPDLESWVQEREVDFAVTLIEQKRSAKLNTLSLLDIPLILLVPKLSPIRSAAEIWRRDRIDQILISLPANEAICRVFQEHLVELGVEWFPRIEVSSLDLVESYVANGFGLGLSVALPKAKPSDAVRALPLTGFPPVTVGAVWSSKLTPLMKAFLAAMQSRVQQLVT